MNFKLEDGRLIDALGIATYDSILTVVSRIDMGVMDADTMHWLWNRVGDLHMQIIKEIQEYTITDDFDKAYLAALTCKRDMLSNLKEYIQRTEYADTVWRKAPRIK